MCIGDCALTFIVANKETNKKHNHSFSIRRISYRPIVVGSKFW